MATRWLDKAARDLPALKRARYRARLWLAALA
jgi:hypothetical protein